MDPTTDPTVIEQFVTALTGLLTIVATAVIAIVGDKVRGVLKDKRLEKAREVVLPGLTRAIDYAHARVEDGRMPTREELLTGATDYAFDNFADALKKLNLDPDSVRNMILARIQNPTPPAEEKIAAPTAAPDPTVKVK